jgi:two-component sensor histidine kinase
LSTAAGRLTVRWRLDNNHVVLEWRETDGPRVRAAAIENFGSRLLRRLVEGQLKGSLRRELGGKGVSCIIEFPIPPAVSDSALGLDRCATQSADTSGADGDD